MSNELVSKDAIQDTRVPAARGQAQQHVLIVEDDAALRDVICSALEDAGFTVRSAEDGIAALAELRREIPAAVIADVSMPRLSGDRLANELADWGLPVILTSGYRDDPELPGIRFIAKPFDLNELIDAVHEAVAASNTSPVSNARVGLAS